MAADRCSVQARMECLPEAIEFVNAFCADHALARTDCLRLALMVEELFTNSVTHGYGGDSDATVRVGLRVDPTQVELSYEDSAPPFDLPAHAASASVDPAMDVADRPVGELGIALVTGMADRVTYDREDGWNRLRLAVRRQPA